jgi:cyclin D1/2/4
LDPVGQQIGDARYVFEAKTIQRMELLVLSTLKWRMQAVTPFSYIDYFLHRLNGGDAPSRRAVLRSAELILCTARGEHASRKFSPGGVFP